MSTIAIPAESAEDFRLAAIAQLAETATWVRTQREALREAEEELDEELDDRSRIERCQADLAGARGHLPRYEHVLRQAATGEPEITGDACALGFVCANDRRESEGRRVETW